MIGVPVATLRYWRHLGTGPKSAKLGRAIVYREEDVIAWVDEQFQPQPSPAKVADPIREAALELVAAAPPMTAQQLSKIKGLLGGES